MKKKMILNICMVVMILLVILCGGVAVGSVKGWFDENGTASGINVSEKNGIAMIERNGVAYEVETGIAIRNSDKLYTKAGASMVVSDGEIPRIYLDGNSEIGIDELTEAMQFEILKGETLLDARGWDRAKVSSGDVEIQLNQAVASVSNQAGVTMVYLYAGEVTVGDKNAAAGQIISFVENDEPEISELKASALNDFQMESLLACGIDDTFFIQEKDIEQVKADREEERLRVQQELLESEDSSTEENATISGSTENSENGSGSDSHSSGTGSNVSEQDSVKNYCTIQIRCDTILNNLDSLTSGKEAYVPSNGIILATSKLAFEEGETAFDVLQRACSLAGIQLEYSYTPIYDSYYIEGINHLYEFDCGSTSGWMYKVNGWFPNYGCSSYILQDGDNIVWCYSCVGLGSDVGGSN